jgi:hypothetical protein
MEKFAMDMGLCSTKSSNTPPQEAAQQSNLHCHQKMGK